MQRLGHAPNIAIAQLWADMLRDQGFDVQVQRLYLSGVAGEIPPDQCLPELWLINDDQLARAREALRLLMETPQRNWVCRSCQETVEGGFEQCWNCGAAMPGTGLMHR
jgi:hypothetical protein